MFRKNKQLSLLFFIVLICCALVFVISCSVSGGNEIISPSSLIVLGANASDELAFKKYDPSGIEDTYNWNKVLTGVTGRGSAVSIDSDNNVYITYYSSGSITVLKYDSNGNRIWAKSNIFGSVSDKASRSVLAKGSYVYVTDASTTTKYDSSGNAVGTIPSGGKMLFDNNDNLISNLESINSKEPGSYSLVYAWEEEEIDDRYFKIVAVDRAKNVAEKKTEALLCF